MSNEVREISVYSKSVLTRIAHEETVNKKTVANCTMIKNLARAATTFDLSAVSTALKSSNVDENFAFNKRISTSSMCMKAIDRMCVITMFAFDIGKNTLEKNSECIIRTVINFRNAKKNITARDLIDTLNAKVKISDDKKALIYQRADIFDSPKRHAEMTERALSALGILKLVNNEYVINNTVILKRLEKKLCA